MNRPNAFAATLAAFALAGCAYGPALPDTFTGPKATMKDTALEKDTGLAWIFEVEQVDDKQIRTSEMDTMSRNKDDDKDIAPVARTYPVAAKPTRFQVSGATMWASAALAIRKPGCRVEGEIDFTPLADHTYVVTGRIAQDACAVWIQDEATGAVMGQKIVDTGLR